jgi:farnesyl-diphosphate farnesyltransferase
VQQQQTDQSSRWSDDQYQNHSLQGVSRTFALTIPQLPAPLCRAVSNAYLLCRIADTIEDEPAISAKQKRYFSQQFIRVVEGKVAAERFAAELAPLLSESTLPAERDLIRNVPRVIRITRSFNARQRDILARAVSIMARGMSVFQSNRDVSGLKDMPELDSYCYYVAGVVGEMLTELFCDYSRDIEKKRDAMMKLAISFGQGLQMTNILKDMWEDRLRGACWLPQEVFDRSRLDLKNLAAERGRLQDAFGEGLEKLIAIARGHLHNALSYTLLVPKNEPGIRRFCLWALGMAVLTLRKINRHRTFTSGSEVKISRRSVKATIFLTNALVRRDRLLKLLFSFAASGLPQPASQPAPQSRRFQPFSLN